MIGGVKKGRWTRGGVGIRLCTCWKFVSNQKVEGDRTGASATSWSLGWEMSNFVVALTLYGQYLSLLPGDRVALERYSAPLMVSQLHQPPGSTSPG